MSMRKIFLLVVAAAGLLALAGSLAKDALVRSLVVRTLGATGFDVAIERLHFGILSPTLELNGMSIRNPTNFPVREAVEINRLFIRYDRASLFGRHGHVPEIDLDLARVVMIRRGNGEVNLERLARLPGGDDAAGGSPAPAAAAEPRPERGAPPPAPAPPRAAPRQAFSLPPVRIDRLRIKLDELDYHDYSLGSEPMVLPVKLNFDETFVNVTNILDIAGQLEARLPIAQLGGANGVLQAPAPEKDAKRDRDINRQIEGVIEGL